jgi:hypothetical protein
VSENGRKRGEERRGEKSRLIFWKQQTFVVVRPDWVLSCPVHVALRGDVRFSRLNRLPEGDVVQCRFAPLVQRFDKNRQLDLGDRGVQFGSIQYSTASSDAGGSVNGNGVQCSNSNLID